MLPCGTDSDGWRYSVKETLWRLTHMGDFIYHVHKHYYAFCAGVDPVSRRALWEILLERKNDLAILLVTHYTDEADILSDQVYSS